MPAELSLGIQADTWHTDNFTNAIHNLARSEVIMEWRPLLQFRVGDPPAVGPLSTNGYFEIRYTPTLHTLLKSGSSRMLHRLGGELGWSTPALTSAVRFEHDENIFGAQGIDTIEESSTVTEVSPRIEYSLTAKTVLHTEATWRRIESQDSATNRSEYILETGITTAVSAKTTLGLGAEFGHIPFDSARFGSQNYQQSYASMVWQSSPRLRMQTRAGIELRQFDGSVPKADRASPVATVIVNWTPSENTHLNAGFLVRNQPSVSQRGATFQEVRFGVDGRQQLGRHFYVRGEAALLQRHYDSGTKELETVLRPALGFRTDTSKLFNSLNLEIYYQFRHVDSNQRSSDRASNIFGLESTLHF